MRRYFVQNIIFLVLVNLVVKPFWIFAIDRNVQIQVGHTEYGQYVMLLNFSIIFQIILDLGLQNFNNRTVAQSPNSIKQLLPQILFTKAILAVGYLVVIILFALISGFRGYQLSLLILLGLVQVLNSLLLYLRSNISALHRFKTDSLLSVSDRLFMILFCSVLLFYPPLKGSFKIEWFIYAQIAAYAISAIIGLIIVLRLSSFNWHLGGVSAIRSVIKQSIPYALLVFFMGIYIRTDVYLLGVLLPNGDYHAGVYAAAYRLLDVANNVTGVLFAGMLLPIFGRMLAKHQSVQALVQLSINLLLPVAIITAVFSFFAGHSIMELQLGNMATDYDGTVFSLLMFAFPGYCIGYVYATLLTANGNIWLLVKISFLIVVFNILANIILIPMLQAQGAAIVCVATQVLLSVLNIGFAVKKLKLYIVLPLVFKYFLFAGCIVLCCYYIVHHFSDIYFQLLAAGSIGIILMAVFGFFPLKKVLAELKKQGS